VRFACLCHDFGKGTTPADVLPRHIGHEQRSARLLLQVRERWRVPNDCKELAEVVAREHGNIHRSHELNAAALLRLLERCDAIRKPQRFEEALQACECDARGRLGFEEAAYPQRQRLGSALKAALAVETAPWPRPQRSAASRARPLATPEQGARAGDCRLSGRRRLAARAPRSRGRDGRGLS
jgi:tRNA nucleotidyltransferase (CCA-adding enzyme)